MGNYGKAAMRAVRFYKTGSAMSPQDAWAKATAEQFGWGTSSQLKGCPKNTFLGLCEEGLIRGIPSGNYTRSRRNKKYAVDAVQILKQRPTLAINPQALWDQVMQGESKQHNQQMDVVISLWNSGLLLDH